VQTAQLARHGAQAELNDLVRTKTELECLVEDLQVASERAGGKREALEAELEEVEGQIEEKERELTQLIPEWETQKEREAAEKRNLEHARSQLQNLYAKQGRLDRFRTKAQRDAFLRQEMASVETYGKSQQNALESAKFQVADARGSLQEVETRITTAEQSMEEQRERGKDVITQLAVLKGELTDLTEQRKELWREDTKLQSLVSHANEELKTLERNLAGMMDKVCVLGFIVFSSSCLNGYIRTLVEVFKLLTRLRKDTTWPVFTVLSTAFSKFLTINSTPRLS
jgi:structural maintenance of chromosome 3 (chondroitin sulfate proteoglycan 6)